MPTRNGSDRRDERETTKRRGLWILASLSLIAAAFLLAGNGCPAGDARVASYKIVHGVGSVNDEIAFICPSDVAMRLDLNRALRTVEGEQNVILAEGTSAESSWVARFLKSIRLADRNSEVITVVVSTSPAFGGAPALSEYSMLDGTEKLDRVILTRQSGKTRESYRLVFTVRWAGPTADHTHNRRFSLTKDRLINGFSIR